MGSFLVGWYFKPTNCYWSNILSYFYEKNRRDRQAKQIKTKRLSSFQYNSIFEWDFTVHWKTYNKDHLRWTHWSQLPSDEMFEFVKDVVFPFIKTLDQGDAFTETLKDASFLIPKASLLSTAVESIEKLHITEQNEDTAWDIYEHLLSEISSSGKNWQFRTPRHIIQLIIDLVDPSKHDKIFDPACGSAWFLINSYKHILKKNTSKDGIIADEHWKHYSADLLDAQDWDRIKKENLNWFDFDSTMVRISIMNSIMHWISNPNIAYQDTLWKYYSNKEEFDIILANPPFKWSIDENDISAEFSVKTKKTELLFLELIYQKLLTGGKAGVIVPDGVLFGASTAHKNIRKILIEQCSLKAVIGLPSWVFKPYAWVSTAILIFTKKDETKKVWFYGLEHDGLSLDDKRAPIKDNDIPDIEQKYKDLVLQEKYDTTPDDKDKWFWVDKKEIVENNYDLSIFKI